MKITQPCIVPNMNEVEYHLDPCPTASASRGFLNTMLRKTPLHAMIDHPRLNPDFESSNKRKFDFGGAAHDYVLRGGGAVSVLDFPDYRTKAAQSERDAALALNKLPILAHDWMAIQDMEQALRRQIAGIDGHKDGLANGKPECAIFWQEDGLWFRTMPDWITDDGWLEDYKTTGIGGPKQFMEGVFVDKGYHIQAFMGLRGYHAVTGQNAKGFRFWVQETEYPHAVYCVTVHNTMMEVAEADFEHGKFMFGRCMETGIWPGYPVKPFEVYPSFRANRNFEDVKTAKNTFEATPEMRKVLNDWCAPNTRKAS